MTLQTLASKIAKIEGKKSQARIGDIREILVIIAAMQADAAVENEFFVYSTESQFSPITPILERAAKFASKKLKTEGRI